MGWIGKLIGGFVGLLMTHNIWGAVAGVIIGHMFDQAASQGVGRSASGPSGGRGAASGAMISQVFFRTTFEFMGHVAKSDGRVSEAEIDAARRVMQEFRLGPNDVAVAIECFGRGKSPSYDADGSVELLRSVCGGRYDLLRTFVELQLRAALAGDGISLPARAILTRLATRLGLSGLEFAYMESALRARQQSRSNQAPQRPREKSLDESYAELGVNATTSDQEVKKAYRRQMSRHHPDKLVANGLPESMAEMAKEKTQRIQEAYESIRAARGMR